MYVCVCVCMCVCMYVCVYVCMYEDVCMYVYVCMYVCMYACMHVDIYWLLLAPRVGDVLPRRTTPRFFYGSINVVCYVTGAM